MRFQLLVIRQGNAGGILYIAELFPLSRDVVGLHSLICFPPSWMGFLLSALIENKPALVARYRTLDVVLSFRSTNLVLIPSFLTTLLDKIFPRTRLHYVIPYSDNNQRRNLTLDIMSRAHLSISGASVTLSVYRRMKPP